jgi:hypothetical protein
VIVLNGKTNTATIEKFRNKYEGIFDDITLVLEQEKFGAAFSRALAKTSPDKYLIVITENVSLNREAVNGLKECVINPGTLHYIDFASKQSRSNGYFSNYDSLNSGFGALLNKKAISLRKFGLDRITNTLKFDEIVKAWDPVKVVLFHPAMEYYAKPYPKKRVSLIKRGLKYFKKHGAISTVKRIAVKMKAKLR